MGIDVSLICLVMASVLEGSVGFQEQQLPMMNTAQNKDENLREFNETLVPGCPAICPDTEPSPKCGGTADGLRNKTFYNICYLDEAIKCHPGYEHFEFQHDGPCSQIDSGVRTNSDNRKVDCDCSYHAGGCTVSIPAPRGSACHCSYKGFWTCGGSIVGCKDRNSPNCKSPGRDYNSCQQGGGNCGGYRCDCCYHSGGCTICATAPIGNACHCSYKGWWTCGGSIVGCKDPRSPHCLKPDKTRNSCIQGFGDCGGY